MHPACAEPMRMPPGEFQGESRVWENRTHGSVGEVKLSRRQATGFTLVELLAVVAIISVLMALFLPALDNALNAAQDIECISQHREYNLALQMRTADNRGAYPWGCPGYRIKPTGDGGQWYQSEAAVNYPWMWLVFEGYLEQIDGLQCPRATDILRYKGGDLQADAEYMMNHTGNPGTFHPANGWYKARFVGGFRSAYNQRINRVTYQNNSHYSQAGKWTYPGGQQDGQRPKACSVPSGVPFRLARQQFVETQWPLHADRVRGPLSLSEVVVTSCHLDIDKPWHAEDKVPGWGGRYPTSRMDGSAAMTWYWAGKITNAKTGYFTAWDNNFAGTHHYWRDRHGAGPVDGSWNE